MPLENVELPVHGNWGEVWIKYHNEVVSFPLHVPSSEIFNTDPQLLVRLKHLGLVCITPLVTLIRSVYWLTQALFSGLSEMYHALDGDEFSAEHHRMMIEIAYDSMRAWKYGALMTGCSFAGIFSPYWGRMQYGDFERRLNRHSDGPHRDKFYTAICFQRLCILKDNDRLNDEDAANKLHQYLSRLNRIFEAIRTLSWDNLVKELG